MESLEKDYSRDLALTDVTLMDLLAWGSSLFLMDVLFMQEKPSRTMFVSRYFESGTTQLLC